MGNPIPGKTVFILRQVPSLPCQSIDSLPSQLGTSAQGPQPPRDLHQGKSMPSGGSISASQPVTVYCIRNSTKILAGSFNTTILTPDKCLTSYQNSLPLQIHNGQPWNHDNLRMKLLSTKNVFSLRSKYFGAGIPYVCEVCCTNDDNYDTMLTRDQWGNITNINSLWPSDIIWQYRPGSISAQVRACCWTAPSHHLNQC